MELLRILAYGLMLEFPIVLCLLAGLVVLFEEKVLGRNFNE